MKALLIALAIFMSGSAAQAERGVIRTIHNTSGFTDNTYPYAYGSPGNLRIQFLGSRANLIVGYTIYNVPVSDGYLLAEANGAGDINLVMTCMTPIGFSYYANAIKTCRVVRLVMYGEIAPQPVISYEKQWYQQNYPQYYAAPAATPEPTPAPTYNNYSTSTSYGGWYSGFMW